MGLKRIIFIGVITLLTGTSIWFYNRIIYDAPVEDISLVSEVEVVKISDTYYTSGNSWLRLKQYGNWECYIEGSGFERGVTLGKLQEKLAQDQEAVFVAEIDKNVPSWWFRKFLILGISWFNRDLDQFIPKVGQKYALIFGNEVKGVAQDVVNICDATIEIPQFGTKHSLNISVSVGVVMWDLFQKIRN